MDSPSYRVDRKSSEYACIRVVNESTRFNNGDDLFANSHHRPLHHSIHQISSSHQLSVKGSNRQPHSKASRRFLSAERCLILSDKLPELL